MDIPLERLRQECRFRVNISMDRREQKDFADYVMGRQYQFDEAIQLVYSTMQGFEKVEGTKMQQMILGMLHLAHELQSQSQELDYLKRDIHEWMISFKENTEPYLEKEE